MINLIINLLVSIAAIAIPNLVTPPGVIELPVTISSNQAHWLSFDLSYTAGVDFVDYEVTLPPPYTGECADHNGLLHCGVSAAGAPLPSGVVLMLRFYAYEDAQLTFDDVRFLDANHQLMPYQAYNSTVTVLDWQSAYLPLMLSPDRRVLEK